MMTDEIKHKWIKTGEHIYGFVIYECSNCGIQTICKKNFCDNCKAEMENGDDSNSQFRLKRWKNI